MVENIGPVEVKGIGLARQRHVRRGKSRGGFLPSPFISFSPQCHPEALSFVSVCLTTHPSLLRTGPLVLQAKKKRKTRAVFSPHSHLWPCISPKTQTFLQGKLNQQIHDLLHWLVLQFSTVPEPLHWKVRDCMPIERKEPSLLNPNSSECPGTGPNTEHLLNWRIVDFIC